MNNQDQMKSMEANIVNQINSLDDKIINLNEIVIKNLQDKNEKLRRRCERLKKWCWKCESEYNALAQYGWRNNVILSGTPESVSEDVLEKSVISVLPDTDVLVESQDIEACHRFGKPDRDKSQKTIVCFVSRKKLQESFI